MFTSCFENQKREVPSDHIQGTLICLNTNKEYRFGINLYPFQVYIENENTDAIIAKASKYLYDYMMYGHHTFDKDLEFTIHDKYVDEQTVDILYSKIPKLLGGLIPSKEEIIETLKDKIRKNQDDALIKSHPYLFKISSAVKYYAYYAVVERTIPAHTERVSVPRFKEVKL